MVQIYCTGPVQEWPDDDSDFETENLPGYKKPSTGKESSSEDDDSGDSAYEDSPPQKKRKVAATKKPVKAKDKAAPRGKSASSSSQVAVGKASSASVARL